MRKTAIFAALCSLLFLAACNTNNDNAQNDDTTRNVENGVNDVMDDTRDAIDDTVDTIDPNRNNGQTNESTIDNNNANPNVDVPNGETAPGAPSVNQEGIIEDKVDRNDKDRIDNN